MINNDVVAWRIVDWDGRYESSRTLKKSGPLAEVTMPAHLGLVMLQRLHGQPDSAAILGVWYYLQLLAAQGDRRGVLSAWGVPLQAQDLASLAGFETSLVERVLDVLSSPEVGLIEQVPLGVALQPPVIEPPTPRKPRKPRTFIRCPKCDADLVQLAESGEFEHLLVPETGVESQDHACGCDKDHAGHCGNDAGDHCAKARTFAEREATIDAPKADHVGCDDEASQTLAASATDLPSGGSDDAGCQATTPARSPKPRSAAAACRKNRKAERQARKKARRIEARHK